MFLDINSRPVFYLKHNVSETGFCLRLQVKPTQLGPIDRTSPGPQLQIKITLIFESDTVGMTDTSAQM
jgi:hypothetical protein